MGWKTIQGRRYLYRTDHSTGKAKSVYVGRGPAAEIIAREVERRKNERAAQQKAIREAKASENSLQQLAQEAADQFQLLLEATLLTSGFYRHDRGAWRPRRFVYGRDGERIPVCGEAPGAQQEGQCR